MTLNLLTFMQLERATDFSPDTTEALKKTKSAGTSAVPAAQVNPGLFT